MQYKHFLMKKLILLIAFALSAASCETIDPDSNYSRLLGKWSYNNTSTSDKCPENYIIEFTERYQIIIRASNGSRRIGMVESNYSYSYFTADYKDGTHEFWEVREIEEEYLHLVLDQGTHFYCTRIDN